MYIIPECSLDSEKFCVRSAQKMGFVGPQYIYQRESAGFSLHVCGSSQNEHSRIRMFGTFFSLVIRFKPTCGVITFTLNSSHATRTWFPARFRRRSCIGVGMREESPHCSSRTHHLGTSVAAEGWPSTFYLLVSCFAFFHTWSTAFTP